MSCQCGAAVIQVTTDGNALCDIGALEVGALWVPFADGMESRGVQP